MSADHVIEQLRLIRAENAKRDLELALLRADFTAFRDIVNTQLSAIVRLLGTQTDALHQRSAAGLAASAGGRAMSGAMNVQKIRLRDLRYNVLTGAIFGGLNGLFAFGPTLIKSCSYDGLTPLGQNGPLVAHWVAKLVYFPVGVAMFALIGALVALPAGYFQLRRFRRRLAEPNRSSVP